MVTYHCDRNVHTLPHRKGDRLLWYNAWIHVPHCDRDVRMFSSKDKYKDMWPWVTCRVTGLYDRCTHLAWPRRVWLVWQGCTYLAWPAGSQGWPTSGAAQRLHDPCHQLSDHWSSGSCLQPTQATQPHAQCSTSCTKSGNVQLPLVTSTEHFIILMTSSKAQILYIYKKSPQRYTKNMTLRKRVRLQEKEGKSPVTAARWTYTKLSGASSWPIGVEVGNDDGHVTKGTAQPTCHADPQWATQVMLQLHCSQVAGVLTLTWSHRHKGHITAV